MKFRIKCNKFGYVRHYSPLKPQSQRISLKLTSKLRIFSFILLLHSFIHFLLPLCQCPPSGFIPFSILTVLNLILYLTTNYQLPSLFQDYYSPHTDTIQEDQWSLDSDPSNRSPYTVGQFLWARQWSSNFVRFKTKFDIEGIHTEYR